MVLSAHQAQHLRRLMAWMETANGRSKAVCPSNEIIMERLALRSVTAVTHLLNAGVAHGFLAVTGRQGGQRIRRIQVLRDPPALPGAVTLAPQPAADFTGWLDRAEAGEKFIYFTGHLAEARELALHRNASAALRAAVAKADEVQDAHHAGLVLLTLRRRPDEHGCDYIAIRGRQGRR